MKADQIRLSYITFTLLLEELLSGPCTARSLSDHTGMGHRYMCRLLRTMHEKKVVHIAGWDKDSLGRNGVRVYGLGAGKDAKRVTKSKAECNRDYRRRASGSALAGTPFAGLLGGWVD